MSSPKHLWSGDWERESPELTSPPPPRVDARPLSPPDSGIWPSREKRDPPDPATGSRRFTALVVAAIVVVLAAVGITLAATLGGGSNSTRASAQNPFSQGSSGGSPLQQLQQTTTTPQATAPQSTTPQSAAPEGQPGGASVTAGPSYNWLGMSIADIASGVAVETVDIGGVADIAGVNPGDVIEQINATSVSSVSQLIAALAKLKLGDTFQLTVDRGSTPVQLTATLTGRPARS